MPAVGRRRAVSDEDIKLFGIDRLNTIRSEVPAVTHVDMSARIQTVHKETDPRYHALLSAFKARTGCLVLVNTSFNVRSEPIFPSVYACARARVKGTISAS
jgi:carbamoyltransferase